MPTRGINIPKFDHFLMITMYQDPFIWEEEKQELPEDFSLIEHVNHRLDRFITMEAKLLIRDLLNRKLEEIIDKYVSKRIHSITDENLDEIMATAVYRLFKHESNAVR